MSITEDQGRKIAHALIRKFDPELQPAVDDLWNDFASGEQADSISRQEHGAGIEQSSLLWGLILVPLVQAIVKKAVDISADALKEWLRRHSKTTTIEQNTKIAEAALAEIHKLDS